VSVVKVDRKGRAVLKKEILNKAGVAAPCTMLASVKSDGVIELKKIGEKLSRATAVGSKKLKGWKEERHAGERILLKMIKHETT
jgi:bifunctional DNA-binding transcriptional regulator/antitoxin component of YhaV-PrlF toxin-antitoxin module